MATTAKNESVAFSFLFFLCTQATIIQATSNHDHPLFLYCYHYIVQICPILLDFTSDIPLFTCQLTTCTLLISKLTLIIVLFTVQIKSIQKTLNELILICLGITINNRNTATIHNKLVELHGIIENIYSMAVQTMPKISGMVNEPLTKFKQDIIELETSIIKYQQLYPRNTEEVQACLAKSATSITTLREAVGGNSWCV